MPQLHYVISKIQTVSKNSLRVSCQFLRFLQNCNGTKIARYCTAFWNTV